jgi:hypothetical protein
MEFFRYFSGGRNMSKKDKRPNSGSILLVLILIFQFQNVSSQVETPDSVITERIQLIQNMLDRGRPNANLWWYGWLAGYSAATITQGAVFIMSNEKATRQDMALGAATTLLGAAGQLLTSNVPGRAPEHLLQLPGGDEEARRQKLKDAEELLKASALMEKAGKSWKIHAITGAVNVSSGLITWLGFKRDLWAGVQNFALNTVITETQIWTQPTKAMKDYQNYCRRFKKGEELVSTKHDINWFVSAYPGGIELKIVF